MCVLEAQAYLHVLVCNDVTIPPAAVCFVLHLVNLLPCELFVFLLSLFMFLNFIYITYMNNESTKYLFTELWQKFYSNNERK